MNQDKTSTIANKLPPIPRKRFFSIGEVSALCDVKDYVLRYWEQEFPQLSPSKRGVRRYYRYHDVLLVRKIRDLLYQQGYTIEGARTQIKQSENPLNQSQKNQLKKIIKRLQSVVDTLDQ
ncbi:MAG: MerR family transcriptional regulator [Gammaproteobacteria bacterium]